MSLHNLETPFLFDDLVDGLWDLDIKNDVVYLSPNASKLFGLKRDVTLKCEEVLNTSIHVEYKERLQNEIGQLLNNRIDNLDIEIKIKSSLNGSRWVHLRGKAISREVDGSPNRLLGSVKDISKCKKAEEDIKKERIILRSIIDNLPAAVYIMDRKGRKVLSSKSDCEFIGVNDESEVLGKTDIELFTGKAGERGHRDNMNVISNRTPITNREEAFIDKNGTSKWLLTSKIPLLNHDNQISGLIGIGVDITEQKKLQKKIAESEAYYRTLVDISPDGIFVNDMDAKFTFISRRFYQILGIHDNTNIIGESFFNWVASDNLDKVIEIYNEDMAGIRPQQLREFKCLKYDRSEFWGEFSSSPLLDPSGVHIGFMVVCRDITDRKKIEADFISAKNKAEENDKLKTAFLHNISHEIRTPLNAIVGFASLLDDMNLSKDQQQSYVDIIGKSSDHLLEIISDILLISNIEAGILNVNENDLDVNELIDDLFNQFNLDSKRKNIQLLKYCGIQDEKVTIRSDKTKLVQILSNLLSNSLKFTDQGVVKFGYRVIESYIQFFVSDTGKGISQDKFHLIFDRFYQVEHTENRLYEGTGLGLSICKAYVELLGGHIWLTSKVGEGTTFYFTIPFDRKKM